MKSDSSILPKLPQKAFFELIQRFHKQPASFFVTKLLLHLQAPKEDEEVKQEVATSLAAALASSLDDVFSLDDMIFMLFSAGFAQRLVSIMLRG